MMTMRFALAAVAAAVLAGCSTTKVEEPVKAPVVDTKPPVAATQPTQPVAETKVATVDLAAEQSKAVADKRVIYFDFDSYVVKDEFRASVDAHAKRLNLIKTQKVSLEGHADQRGSREYNLALGQKRAEAVMQQLSLQGVAAGPSRAGQLRQGAPGHGRHGRGRVGQEPPRRSQGQVMSGLSRALAVFSLAAWLPLAQAGLFDDEEARKAIMDLRAKIAQLEEAQRKARLAAGRSGATLGAAAQPVRAGEPERGAAR